MPGATVKCLYRRPLSKIMYTFAAGVLTNSSSSDGQLA